MKQQERRKYWQRMVTEHAASGLTQVAFAKLRGIKVKSLARWRKRLLPPASVPAVVEVVVEDLPASPSPRDRELLVGGDLSLFFAPGTEPGYVADVVLALKARRAC